MPQGDLRGSGWEFFDSTYDGHWDGDLRRGLGQLTDGKVGPDNFKMGYYDYERGACSKYLLSAKFAVVINFIHSVVVSQQIHSLFQTEFSTECDLVLFLSITSILSSSCLRLLPRLPVTSILPSIFPFLTFYKTVPTQDVTNPGSLPSFLLSLEYFCLPRLCVTLFHFSQYRYKDLLHPSPAPHLKTFQVFLIPSLSTIQSYTSYVALY